MRLILRLFRLTLIIVLLSACTMNQRPESQVTEISAASIASSDDPPSIKAEKLAQAAEKVSNPMAASQKVAAFALEQDPQNLRAKFIKVLSAALLTQKGIATRIRPLLEKKTAWLKDYEKYISQLKSETSQYDAFLLDGKADIHTEADLQAYLDSVISALDGIRIFAKENKTSELTIKPTAFLKSDLATNFARACELKVTGNLEYEIKCPPNSTRREVTLNQADFQILQFTSAFYMFALSIYNSYDLTGAIATANKLSSLEDQSPTFEKTYAALSSYEKFGLLRSPSRLKQIKEMGQDIVVALRWASANSDTLCPTGQPSPRNRIGMFFPEGLCHLSYFQEQIKLLADFFSGQPQKRAVTRESQIYTTTINWMGLFDNPVTDLRLLGPIKFDSCGNVQSVGDPAMSGVFPNRDANIHLPRESPVCRKP